MYRTHNPREAQRERPPMRAPLPAPIAPDPGPIAVSGGGRLRCSSRTPPAFPVRLHDDYDALETGDRVLLVVEDDVTFASTMIEIAHQAGFKVVIASSGVQALELARSLAPDAVTLDLRLPTSTDGCCSIA